MLPRWGRGCSAQNRLPPVLLTSSSLVEAPPRLFNLPSLIIFAGHFRLGAGPEGEEFKDGKEGGKEETWFPSKLSACNLYPAVYACFPKDGMAEAKAALLENFAALSDDEMPMVRASAAKALAGLSPSVGISVFRAHLLPIFKLVSEDRSDVVRETGVKSMTAFLATLPAVTVSEGDLKKLKGAAEGEEGAAAAVAEPSAGGDPVLEEVVTEVTGLFLKGASDSSWRVRLACVGTMEHALPPADAKTKGEMLASFADLLDDEEGDVKLAATKATSLVYAAATSKDMFDALVLPTVLEGFQAMLDSAKAMAEGAPVDASKNELRQAQALVAMELAAFDAIPHPMLVAVVQHMFEDPSLCIKMLDKFELLAKLKESDPSALSTICMDSLSLGVHDDWRVRCAFTAKLSFIFEQIISVESSAAAAERKDAAAAAAEDGAAATPKKTPGAPSPATPLDKDAVERAWTAFKSVVDGALWDEVAEARVHFVDCLPDLVRWADKIGGDRYVKQLVAMLLDQYKSESGKPIPGHPDRKMSYLYKISVLASLQSILSMSPAPEYFATPSNVTELLDLVLAACKDSTPNVRLVAGRAVGEYALACCGGYGASPGALQTVEMSLVPTLQTMTTDADMDVKSTAQVRQAPRPNGVRAPGCRLPGLRPASPCLTRAPHPFFAPSSPWRRLPRPSIRRTRLLLLGSRRGREVHPAPPGKTLAVLPPPCLEKKNGGGVSGRARPGGSTGDVYRSGVL